MSLFQISSTDVAIFDRFTRADEVGAGAGSEDAAAAFAWWSFGMLEQYRQQHVTPQTALTYSAVWACIRWISQTIASFGWDLFEKNGENREAVGLDDQIAWIIDQQPNGETDAFNWRQTALVDALTVGNSYSEIEKDGAGNPRFLYRISPDRVSPDRSSSGRLIYEVENGSGVRNSIFYPDEIFHLKGLGPDGIVGYSVIEMARRTIRAGLQQEQFGEQFFARGPMPGGVLEVPGSPTKEAMDAQRTQFEKTYGGTRNAGRVIVLKGGNKFTPLTLPNTDAQFLESRQFSVTEIARWYGVPPHKIGDLTRSTNNNIEHQAIEGVQDCLMPWCKRLESEGNIKLLGRKNRGKRYTRLNLAAILRGDTLTQTEAITKQVNGGLATPNEGRRYLDRNPVEGGDVLLVQGAMMPLERLLEEPAEPAPAPPPDGAPAPGGNPKPPDSAPPADVAKTFTAMLRDVYANVLHVEADKAKRARNKGELDRWAAEFYGAHRGAVAAKLSAAVAALLLVRGVPADHAPALAQALAERHVAASRAELSAGAFAAWTDSRPQRQAAEHFELAWRFQPGAQ